ncbi:UDP-glucose dehydrogenase family protein [Calderihabitans maritimus]|uniref:UDP-glucose 6-dehydrogenase n=1 Tax=Calderihabitans maritimus TaxID=1246530 RepID=A0A1Z5HWX9_9FIRM|nr:UDP-glucose/GDP-mannose dehydrogenase family protein [Calderihabitans maritimus]GAW94039.1 nucleotide sugar dehydrogenase [Calderihabitans maritimus]
MKVSVIGMGYVGLVATCALANSGHEVIGIEKDVNKLTKLRQGKCPIFEQGLDELLQKLISENRIAFSSGIEAVNGSDIVMLAVGTPAMPNGRVDLSQVYGVVSELVKVLDTPTILVMKSTVPPGTGESICQRYLKNTKVPIAYISNPEFLREGQALKDWYYPDRIVIGGDDDSAIEQVKRLYGDIDAPILVMGITSAEMVKYASNAFLATKISFINEIANLCELVGADIDEVAPAVGMDSRIGKEFLRAGLGYGGSCFPKDTKGLDYVSVFKGYNFRLLKAVIEVNTNQRIRAVRKLERALDGLAGKHVAILGLAFKPGTDDIREAPSLDIIPLLLVEGATVTAYDPLATENARKVLPPDVKFADNPYDCIEGAQAVLLATEWPEFSQLDWLQARTRMKSPYVILDGRNALEKDELNRLGFQYYGIGR